MTHEDVINELAILFAGGMLGAATEIENFTDAVDKIGAVSNVVMVGFCLYQLRTIIDNAPNAETSEVLRRYTKAALGMSL